MRLDGAIFGARANAKMPIMPPIDPTPVRWPLNACERALSAAVLVAFFLGPLADLATTLVAAIFPAFFGLEASTTGIDWGGIPGLWFTTAVFSVPGIAFVGFPFAWWMEEREARSIFGYGLAGGIGAVLFSSALFQQWPDDGLAVLFAHFGIVHGLLFAIVLRSYARQGRSAV